MTKDRFKIVSLIPSGTEILKWEDFVNSNPDIIIFMPCGFDINRTRIEASVLTQNSEWKELQAVKTLKFTLQMVAPTSTVPAHA